MDDIRFTDVMQRERERLNRERDAILNQQKKLENKLTEINFELAAIDAYEAAKTGNAYSTAELSNKERSNDRAARSPTAGNEAGSPVASYWRKSERSEPRRNL